MPCRIGMSTNVDARVQKLVDDGLVPAGAKYRVLMFGLTYEDANREEVRLQAEHGCEGHPGGGYVSGRVWSVYRVDW